MRNRTPEEIKAYADGYNEAYEQFKNLNTVYKALGVKEQVERERRCS